MEAVNEFIPHTFDDKIYYQLIVLYKELGYKITYCTHLGGNVFEMHTESLDSGFMSGHGATEIVTLENDNIKVLERLSVWMS